MSTKFKWPKHDKLKSTDTFCVLPWLHLNVQPNGDIYPCCMAPYGENIGNTSDVTLEEVWNGDKMKEIRKQMLVGERPHLCNRCFLIEDNGLNSPRYTHNDYFRNRLVEVLDNTDVETGHVTDYKLRYWDFRWSNICNFKCRMCGVYSSSKWHQEAMELHGDTTAADSKGILEFNSNGKENVFTQVDRFINDVEEIYFAGGEPLVMEEHYIILEKLIAAGRTDVRLRYNTNFSHLKFKKWDLFGMWQKFLDDPKGHIQLFASLDAVGKLAEVIRDGTKWNNVYENIKKCQGTGIQIYFSPTISSLNMFFIDELIDVAAELDIDTDKVNVNNLLTTPPCYDVRLLPDYLKKELLDKLKDYRDNRCPDKYKVIMKYGVQNWEHFINEEFKGDRDEAEKELLRQTLYLDINRQQSFLEVNPQYTEWFKEIRHRLNTVNHRWMTLPKVRREELKIQQTNYKNDLVIKKTNYKDELVIKKTNYKDDLVIKKTTKPEPAKDEKKWFPSNKTLI